MRLFSILVVAGILMPACVSKLDNARVTGTVTVSQQHDLHHGAPIRVAFRARDAAQTECEEDSRACLTDGAWDAGESCSVKRAERASDMRVTIGASNVPFEACTGAIDAGRQIDVVAYIDLDEDGALSPGEPYGIGDAGPASADLEPLSVRINKRR